MFAPHASDFVRVLMRGSKPLRIHSICDWLHVRKCSQLDFRHFYFKIKIFVAHKFNVAHKILVSYLQ